MMPVRYIRRRERKHLKGVRSRARQPRVSNVKLGQVIFGISWRKFCHGTNVRLGSMNEPARAGGSGRLGQRIFDEVMRGSA